MIPYKQTSSQSCLSVCLLMHVKNDITQDEELELLYEGLRTTEPYAVSVLRAFVKKYKKDVTVFVDNTYYCQLLQKKFATSHISFIHKKIDLVALEEMIVPTIVYINTHSLLGTWDYSPHFVIVESQTEKFFTIIDPAQGIRMKVGKNKFYKSISVLRERLHYCPLLIKVGK